MASRISTIFFTFSKGSIFFSIAKILIKTLPLVPPVPHLCPCGSHSHLSHFSARAARTPTCLTSLPVRLALPPVSLLCPCGSHSHLSHFSARAARTTTRLTSLPVRLALPALPPLTLTLFIKYLSIISSV